MDRSLMVSWYDLTPATLRRYCDWLHETYITEMLAVPGVLGAAHYEVDQNEKPLPHLRHTQDASLPQGGSHIFILTARDAHVLAGLTPFRRKPGAKERRMLALRVGERVNIFTEEARALGPEAKRREGRYTLAPGIQIGNFNSGTWQDEDELLSWYAHLRLPNFASLPGGICIRKMASVSGWAKHGVLYEFTSLEARAENFRAHEAADRKRSAWTHDVVSKLVHAPGSPAVAQRIWPPVKAGRRRKPSLG